MKLLFSPTAQEGFSLIELMVTWKIGWDERNHEIAG